MTSRDAGIHERSGDRGGDPRCPLCAGREADDALQRVEVWRDELWRLTVALSAEVPGFAYLEPIRHIAHVTDLDGEEAASFGPVLARVTGVLREVTGAELVYVYVFGGGIPHLHVHLAPHRGGDALNDRMIRGEVEERRLPGGALEIVSTEFPPLPEEGLRRVATEVGRRLRETTGWEPEAMGGER